MDGRIDEIAATVAAVTQAAGTALDPSTILTRTFTALAPAVEVAGARLWLGDGDDLRLAAATPHEQVAMPPEAHLVALVGVDRAIGQLAIAPLPGQAFGAGERALLEIAAGQIAGPSSAPGCSRRSWSSSA